MEKKLCPQNKQLKGGLWQGKGWQAPRDPAKENLKLFTQRAKAVEGCSVWFSPPSPLSSRLTNSAVCPLGALV